MPMDKKRYPANWKQIAAAVKEAAGWRCQQCGKQCRRPGEKLDTHQRTLTVHHIDHQPENCEPANLIALCAPCHLRADAQHHAESRKGRQPAGEERLNIQKREDRKQMENAKYIIKAEQNPMGGGNPEFAPQKELRDGIEADGFLILTFKGDRPGATVIHGLTTMDLARMIASQEGGSVLYQAIAIAEGLNKAAEIMRKNARTEMAKTFAELLKRE